MAKTILICGHGPGISDAVARKFGAEGYAVALVARDMGRLGAAAGQLAMMGVKVQAFSCDLAEVAMVRNLVADVRRALGPISVIHWNAYGGGARNLLASRPEELEAALAVGVHCLIAAVREAHDDLVSEKGAVLITGGGLALYDPKVDAMAVEWGAMGLAVAKAAQHKTAGLLHAKLAPEGVYVGEVVVTAPVKGTSFDRGSATLEASAIADRFWEQLEARTPATSTI